MIHSRQDLQRYLRQDQIALGKGKQRRPIPFGDEVWRFERLLRQTEYRVNCAKTPVGKALAALYRLRFHLYSVKLGFAVPLNTCAEGLAITHYGTLIVNTGARIGKNCRINAMVVIGASGGSPAAPVIGDNVYIGAGAKILGGIRVADGVAVGANAVVVKSIEEPNTTWGGVPARKISEKGAFRSLCPDLFPAGDVR